MKAIHDFIKRVFDFVFSLIGIVVLLPFFLFIAIAIRLESIGPIIFKQARLGHFGREFYIYKFRSMIDNAESLGTGLFNYADDPRVTKVGAFLRKTSLDELPQLFNIIKGEMSFVGPRPPVTYELGKYADFDPNLKRRFTVKPGVTGYAQINGRNALSWDQKMEHDFRYVGDFYKWGLLLDLKILAITLVKVIRMEGSYELPENAEADQAKLDRFR